MSGNGNIEQQKDNRGKIVIISGPSGVGKSTICREALKRIDNAYLSISATSRPKSDSEVDGQDYWFITKQEFQQRLDKGFFLEHAEVFDNLYGTPRDKVEQALEAGKTVVLEIDVQGGEQVRVQYPDAVMVFILPPSQKELAGRLKHRGREDTKEAEERLELADDEIAAAWQYYNHMVINEDLKQAVNEVVEIIKGA